MARKLGSRRDAITTLINILLLTALMTACSRTPRGGRLIPEDLVVERRFSASVFIVSGESSRITTKIELGNEITNDQFVRAVTEAIKGCRLFQDVTDMDHADYLLQVSIFDMSMERSKSGKPFCMASSEWKITRRGSSETIYQEAISSKFFVPPAFFKDGFTSCTESREGAIRRNIHKGIQSVSRLDL